MPIPKPNKDESKDDFVSRCMSDDVMKSEYDDDDQRVAICMSQWKKKEKKASDPKYETRQIPFCELRILMSGERKQITGYAAVFNKLSEDLGGFREKIKPGAFSDAIEGSDTRALWNHDTNIILGRKSAGTLRLTEDKKGLAIEIDPPSWAGPYIESIERGDVKEMSFGFIVGTDSWAKKDEENIRTLEKIAELPDVSPVIFPAYKDTDISVALRSMSEWREKQQNPPEPTLKETKEQEPMLHMRQRQIDLIKKQISMEDF